MKHQNFTNTFKASLFSLLFALTITLFSVSKVQAMVYCPLFYSAGCGPAFIKNVTIVGTTLNNNSICTVISGIPAGGGTLYPQSGSTTASLQQGLSYTMSVISSTPQIISFWIDYNQNSIFDFNEWTNVTQLSAANIASTVSFTIPMTAIPGATRLRVRSRGTGNTNGPLEACDNFFSGEGEDYTITITPAPACIAPVNAGTTISTKDSVCANNPFVLSLSGASIANGLSYQWQSSSNGTSWTNDAGATSATYTVAAITAPTYYQCIVSCGASNSTSIPLLVSIVGPEYYDFAALTTLHFSETFDTWVDVCDNNEVPFNSPTNTKNYWKANPPHGNQSWRRQDEGFTTGGWTTVNSAFNLQTHAGTGAACFHSYSGTGLPGSLELYLNCTNFFFINLEFFYFKNNHVAGQTTLDTFQVQVSTNGGISFTTIATYLNGVTGISPLWQQKTINNLPVWNSSTVILRFYDSGDVWQSNDTGLDDISIDGILGTGDMYEDNTSIAVLPNPSNGRVQLHCGNNRYTNSKLQLIDIMGRIVYTADLKNSSDYWSQDFDWSSQAKGAYFVKLISDTKVFTQRIVLE